jgi:hypothetical protein
MEENLSDLLYQEEIQRIIENTGKKELVKDIKRLVEKYTSLDSEFDLNLTKEAIETIAATAEETKNSALVTLAVNCFLLEEIEEVLKKYRKNKLNVSEIFSDIATVIHRKIAEKEPVGMEKIQTFKRYIEWLGNGFISKLLNFVSEFPNNGLIPLQQDVFYILNIEPSKLEDFNEYATRIYRKKIPIEKKIELMLFLSLVFSIDRKELVDVILSNDIKNLKKAVEKELKLSLPSKYSLGCGINFLRDMNKDPNLKLIYEKAIEHGGIENWFKKDEAVRDVINLLDKNGFNSRFFVNSGEIVSQKKQNGVFFENWVDLFKHIVVKILGSKKNEMLPKISIPHHSPGSLFKKIKEEYKKAIEGDKEAAKNTLSYFSFIIRDSYKDRGVPKSVVELLQEIESFNYMVDSGIVTNYRGSKVTARVWKRRIPQDLYDVYKLWCCWFLPQNENQEIPLFFMDPKVTLLQFYVRGIESPIAVAFLYAGKVNGENSILVDTWEGGPFAYISLGQEKTHEFVLKSLINFTRRAGAKKLLIYAHPKYTRAKEFGNFLKDRFKIERVFFQTIDVEDTVLKKHSKTFKHHTTDAFGKNSSIKGEMDVFVFNC